MFSAEDYLQGWIVYSIGAQLPAVISLAAFAQVVLGSGSSPFNPFIGCDSVDSGHCLSR